MNVRLTPERLAVLDAWREAQPDKPTRPEAIRRLVDLALAPARGRDMALKYAAEMTDEEDAALTFAALADPDNPPRGKLRRKR